MMLLNNLFFLLCFVIIGRIFLNYQVRDNARIYFALGAILCSVIEFLTEDSAVIFFPLSLLCTGFTLFCIFEITLKHLFFFEIFSYCAISVLNQLVKVLFHNISISEYEHRFATSILRDLIVCVLLYAICKIKSIRHPETGKLSLPYILFFITVIAIDTAVILLIGNSLYIPSSDFSTAKIFITYCLVIIGILIQIFLLIYMINSRNQYRENERLAKHYLENQIKHYEYLEKRDYQTKKFRHDIRGHLYMLNHLLEENKIDEYKSYLNELTANYEHIDNAISVNHGIADAILNKYFYEAQKHHITLQVDGHFPPRCDISAYDICTIFSNLLDNAMEAVISCNGSTICFQCRYTDTEIIFVFENDCLYDCKNPGKYLKTQKADVAHHGFGLGNVKECVHKNHGYMNIDTSDHRFRVMLSLNRRDNNEHCNC